MEANYMTPEAQRIAIAEACGWTDIVRTDKSGYYHGCLMGNHDFGHLQPIPDYLNDLNAMHEAERVLTEEQLHEYGKQLGEATTVMTWWDSHISGYGMAKFAHATAAQRAEAFLRTLGLWI